MKMMQKKITFGLIVGTRNIFNAKLASEERKKVLGLLDRLGLGYIIPDKQVTPAGSD